MTGNQAASSGLKVLAEILEREKRRGLETVPLGPAAAETLRRMASSFRMAKAVSPSSESEEARTRGDLAVEIRRPAPPVMTAAADRGSPGNIALPAPATTGFEIPRVPEEERTEAWRRAQLNAIFKAVKSCPGCRGLGTLFETLVFAVGNPCAPIVLVGEAPGAEEEKQKKPFVGPAGQKLDQILKAMGLNREDVYISNIMKYRPKVGDGRFQGSGNRPPTHEEMAMSLRYIRAEIEVVGPKVVVALGRTAAEGLLERGGSLAGFRNANHEFAGIPVIVTYHPSYLLRQEAASAEEGLRAKRQVWEDMLRVMEHAGLPVSERQRRYFL